MWAMGSGRKLRLLGIRHGPPNINWLTPGHFDRLSNGVTWPKRLPIDYSRDRSRLERPADSIGKSGQPAEYAGGRKSQKWLPGSEKQQKLADFNLPSRYRAPWSMAREGRTDHAISPSGASHALLLRVTFAN